MVSSSITKMTTFVILSLTIMVYRVSAEGIGLKFLNGTESGFTVRAIFNASLPHFSIGNHTINRLCVSGKWIFYNEPMYGSGRLEPDENFQSFLVPHIGVGYSTTDSCYNVADLGFDLTKIQSIRAISEPYSENFSITIFPKRDFFGQPRMLDSDYIWTDGFLNLGSLIVNKMNTSTMAPAMEICQETSCFFFTVCVNFNSLPAGYEVRDTSAKGNIRWPKQIRKVKMLPSSRECKSRQYFLNV